MTVLIALAVSIGLLAVVATWVFLGPLAAFQMQIWQAFIAWACFFIAMGLLNLYVAYNYSEETWVNFKMFGGMGLMLAFVLAQGFYLSRHMEEENN